MSQKKSIFTKKRQKYSSQFREQAVARAKKDGVPKAAKDLGIHEAMLYSWRKKHERTGIPFEDQKIQSAELTRLKRDVARLSEENAFLKKAAVDSIGHCNAWFSLSSGE
jgi:transposase